MAIHIPSSRPQLHRRNTNSNVCAFCWNQWENKDYFRLWCLGTPRRSGVRFAVLGNRWHHPLQLAHGPRWGAHSTLQAWVACLLSAVPREAEMWAFFQGAGGSWGRYPSHAWLLIFWMTWHPSREIPSNSEDNLVQMLRTFSLAGWADYLGVRSGRKTLQMIPISLQNLSLTTFGPQETHCKYLAGATPENACLLPGMM